MQQNIIFVFPGQGAQYVGMGADLYRDFAAARYTFQEISDIAHRDIARMCFDGPQSELIRPTNTSLAVLAHSVAVAKIIEEYFAMPLYKIGYAMSGHSMGQYSALHCADSVSMRDAVGLTMSRASYMSMPDCSVGGMLTIVGLDIDKINTIINSACPHGFAAISNHNGPNNFVVSGQSDALDVIMNAAKNMGAVLVRRLNVSVPAHCALMAPAGQMLAKYVKDINISEPKTNLFSNQTASFISSPNAIKKSLVDQMTHGVRWAEIMEGFPKYNISRAYELGPGKTLTGLIKRANVGCTATNTDNTKNIGAMLNELGNIMVNRSR